MSYARTTSGASSYSKLDLMGMQHISVDGKQEYEPPPRRAYDMCMVFRYKTSKTVKYEEKTSDFMPRTLHNPTAPEESKMNLWKQRREGILKTLNSCGIHLYCYYSRDRDEIIVKIGAGVQKLRDTAMRMKYKLQLKEQYLNAYAEYRNDFPGRPERQFKDRRLVSHIYKSHAGEDFADSDSIFKTIDKICIIHHIIISKDKDCAGINIGNMLYQDELQAYFPLHETTCINDFKKDKIAWFLTSPDHANKLRDYFGAKIAFYFLFMGFYWKWLVPLAGLGLLINFVDMWRGPDNPAAVPFSLAISMWAMFMPYFWRRQEAKYAIAWGTLDMQQVLERYRPQYHGEPRINPVTAEVEPYYPMESRIWMYVCSGITMLITGVVLCFSLLAVLIARHRSGGGLGTQIMIAFFVEATNAGLSWLSGILTTWENHRTQTEHESRMLIKVVAFKFLNSYFVLFYIAFWKNHKDLFGFEMVCYRDCFTDLETQLGVFIIVRLTISNIMEFMLPKVKLWYRTWTRDRSLARFLHGNQRLELAELSAPEAQSKKDKYSEFSDFSETLITHGYTTFFAVTAPWVCCATLIGILFEIFIDMTSIMDSRQRPVPVRARSNEPWSTAFDYMGFLAGTCNLMLLIFASEQYADWTMSEKLTFFLYLEHVFLLLRLSLAFVFPSVPSSVELLHMKQEMMVHRCLENIKVEDDKNDFSMFRDTREQNVQVHEHDYLEGIWDQDEEEPRLELRRDGETMLTSLREIMPTIDTDSCVAKKKPEVEEAEPPA